MDENIKQKLLELAEDLTEDAVENVFTFIKYYIEYTPNKYDDVLLPFVDNAKEFILKYVDKIDGETDDK